MVDAFFWFFAFVLFLLTLPGTIELALLTTAALLPRPKPASSSAPGDVRLAVIVPVHNEERVLARTIASILSCDDPVAPGDIVVMACNCTDRTVAIAKELGCTVFERIDPARRGKGYGLDHAFRRLAASGYSAYLIVDADTVVASNFLTAFRRLFARGADGGQCILAVANPTVNARTRLMNISFLSMTFLRPLARQRLGLSVGLHGNGFGLSAATVRDVPYECFSITEDLEYHTALVRAGKRVMFLGETSVSTEMCITGAEARSQRERWEGGRLRMIVENVPRLSGDLCRGRIAALEPLLELLLLPLGYHASLLLLLCLIARGPLLVYAILALGILAAHVALAMVKGGAQRDDWLALAQAPAYVLWKFRNLPGILKAARKTTIWQRTARTDHQA
jgi:cellulose synthase/poly-beta-1,6-N-acetylglucosamine synthase-like glycosyltransferase